MPEPTPNTITWREILTPDVEGTRRFYGELFGWTSTVSRPTPEIEYHVFFNKDGVPVAGCMKNSLDDGTKFCPPCWCQYILVDELEPKLELAKANGGELCNTIVEVPQVGRFVFVKDSGGAAIGFWQGLS